MSENSDSFPKAEDHRNPSVAVSPEPPKEGWGAAAGGKSPCAKSPSGRLKRFFGKYIETGEQGEMSPLGDDGSMSISSAADGIKMMSLRVTDIIQKGSQESVNKLKAAGSAVLMLGSSSIASNNKSLRETLESAMDDECIDQDRLTAIKGKMADEEQLAQIKEKIILIKYATDASYFSDSTPDEIWETFKRREAWEDNFWKMFCVTAVQFMLCVFPLIGENAPMTSGTMFTTFLYVVANLLFTDMANAHRLLAKILAVLKPTEDWWGGYFWYVAVLIASPMMAVGFFIALAFDFAVGDTHSASYARFLNDAVVMFVKCTSISVGLRSPTPLAALASFVGFSYITDFDEFVVETIHLNLAKPLKVEALKGIDQKVFNVLTCTYLTAVLNYAVVGYFTFNNRCFVYCDE